MKDKSTQATVAITSRVTGADEETNDAMKMEQR